MKQLESFLAIQIVDGETMRRIGAAEAPRAETPQQGLRDQQQQPAARTSS